jgi:hypothetical protein
LLTILLDIFLYLLLFVVVMYVVGAPFKCDESVRLYDVRAGDAFGVNDKLAHAVEALAVPSSLSSRGCFIAWNWRNVCINLVVVKLVELVDRERRVFGVDVVRVRRYTLLPLVWRVV